jgi:hypothetical protein
LEDEKPREPQAPDEALKELNELFAKGFRNRKLLGTDPIFTSIRSEPVFGELLASMENRIQQDWSKVAAKPGCASVGASGCVRASEQVGDRSAPNEQPT